MLIYTNDLILDMFRLLDTLGVTPHLTVYADIPARRLYDDLDEPQPISIMVSKHCP